MSVSAAAVTDREGRRRGMFPRCMKAVFVTWLAGGGNKRGWGGGVKDDFKAADLRGRGLTMEQSMRISDLLQLQFKVCRLADAFYLKVLAVNSDACHECAGTDQGGGSNPELKILLPWSL